MDFAIIKKHPYLISGSIVGIVVLWIILRHSRSAGNTSSSVSPSPADLQLAQLNAATGVQQSQIAAQVAIAQSNTSAQKEATDAALQASEFQTAAQLQLGTLQTQADVVKTLAGDSTTLQLAKISADQAISLQEIQGKTATDIAGIEAQVYENAINAQASVESQRIKTEANIIGTLQKYSKHYSQDIVKTAPALAIIAGAPTAGANSAAEIQASGDQKTASIVGSITSGFTSIFNGLFAKG